MTNLQLFSDTLAYMGRHVNHDERSKAFAVDTANVTLVSVRHERKIPVLNQGQLGSCTGNAMTGLLGTAPYFDTLPAGTLSTTDADANEQFAVDLYSLATQLDGYKGQYPPTDTGSDGLSVSKAAKQKGLIDSYKHAFGLQAALGALVSGPVIFGINWYTSFETPDSNGLVTISDTAYVEGGHEIVADELDVERKLVGFTNSWGQDWGLAGRFYIPWSILTRLLAENGDVTVPVPLKVATPVVPTPAPVPTPVPPIPTPQPVTPVDPTPAPVTPSTDPEDEALWAVIQEWAKAKGFLPESS